MTRPIIHVVGARPNFMKAAPVWRALAGRGADQQLVHTGQHYDAALSEVFFRDLGLPAPAHKLGVGSGSHAVQTAAVMVALEPVLITGQPSLVIVYGDVNSTLAASLVASKLHVPVAHVEAGLRSFDDTMPEEINRRVTDLLSDLLLVTAPEGLDNLAGAGTPPERIHFVGNPMIDSLVAAIPYLDVDRARSRFGLDDGYAVATIHRPSNVDNAAAAGRIAAMLDAASHVLPLVVPLHPRGRMSLERAGMRTTDRLQIVEPLSYLDFMALVHDARAVITDSGGVQEETTFLGVPCLTVRPNTERPITVTHGTNRLVEPEDVPAALREATDRAPSAGHEPPPLWDGHAGDRIATVILDWLGQTGRRRANGMEASGS